MFAVIKTGGKQYTVHENDVLRVERLDAEPGSILNLDEVLMIGNGTAITIGEPTVPGARVEATIVRQARGRKIIVFKKIRRHNHRRKNGHRQFFTDLKIGKIISA